MVTYRRFLDDEGIDWLKFPTQKLSRPTYRYRNHLLREIQNGAIAASSAKRRIGSVIAFYKWLEGDGLFIPANPPWQASDIYITLVGEDGVGFKKKVTTTDISINIPKQVDPYAGTIDDGGKLRPLPITEQRWIMEALITHGNTEMTLMHLLALATGARIQTVLTIRVGHIRAWAQQKLSDSAFEEIRCLVGPGTGIDTKNDKRMSLHIPVWLMGVLLTYANSDRARFRRNLAKGGDIEEQYLFLTKYGTPFYSSKEDKRNFDASNKKRQPIKGQSVRKFKDEVIIPYVRAKYDPTFHYQIHDLRASYGMNLTDNQLKLVEQGKRTLSQVREFVMVRMGHNAVSVTDGYLQYRGNVAHIRQVEDDHDEYLMSLVAKVGF